jgi:hypothetical protein
MLSKKPILFELDLLLFYKSIVASKSAIFGSNVKKEYSTVFSGNVNPYLPKNISSVAKTKNNIFTIVVVRKK